MVVPIILLCLILIICSLLICFLYYVLFPSVQSQMEIKDDPIIAFKEIHYNKEKKEIEMDEESDNLSQPPQLGKNENHNKKKKPQ